MHSSTLLGGAALALASIALAEDVTKTATITSTKYISSSSPASSSTTVPVPNPGKGSSGNIFSVYDIYELHGTVTPVVSIITVNPTATVYKAACPLQTLSGASSGCGILDIPLTVTQGPGSLAASRVVVDKNATATIYASCKIDGTKAATCINSAQVGNAAIGTTDTVTLTATDVPTLIPARVTAGGYKLQNATAPHGSGSISGSISGSGAARPTGLTTTTPKTGPKPTASPKPSAPGEGAAAANAPVMAGVGALAGLVIAAFAL